MIKKIILSTCVLVFITACSDKKEEQQTIEKSEKTQTTTQAPLKIEVVKNENSKEIKVEEKKKVKNENETYYFNYNDGVTSEYDPNSKPANNDAAIRVKPRTNIDANMHVRSPYEKVQISMLVKKLSKEFIVKCSACHNDYANGIIGPSLLKKDSKYIFDKIKSFKEDQEKNILMSALVKNMPESEIKKLADEIYEFNKQIRDLK